MGEIPIKEQIAKLIALQKIDKEAYDIQIALKEKPLEIDRLKLNFDSLKAKLSSLEEKLKGSLLSRKKDELDLQTKEDLISKHNGQLSQLKTNKEYHAKQAEIESVKADKSIIEEKILISYDASDKLEAEIKQEKALLAEKEKQFLSDKKVIEDELSKLKSRLSELEQKRQGMTEGIDAALKSRYEQLLVNKHGVAIVPIEGAVCGGCYMNLTPQMINSVRLGTEMIACEMCSRFLYLEENNS